MRCPSCGTENAPDSRFCGGCGARLVPSTQGLAPTQKISDDASYPQRQVTASAGHGGQVIAQPSPGRFVPPPAQHTSGPSSASPPRAISSAPTGQYGNAAPASSPPNGSAKQLPPRPRTSQLDDLSMPMVARRPWGLIILVLLIDIGLGVTGVLMLNEGLGDKPSAGTPAPRSGASTTPASAVAASAAPGTPPGTPHTAAASPGLAPDTAPAAPNGSGAAAPTNGSAEPMATTGATRAAAQAPAPPGAGSSTAAADKPAKRHHTTVKQPGGTATASGPVDPYATSAPVPDRLPPESK